jgi:hypothetical protein
MSTSRSKNWFVWTEEEGFEYFETEIEAISVARDKIPTFFDGEANCWLDGVDTIKVGQMTRETAIVNRVETEAGFDCNYHLQPFENLPLEFVINSKSFWE